MIRLATTVLAVLTIVAILAGAGVLGLFFHFGRGLPDYQQLADYEPPVVTRVHAGDGRLLGEYATEKRVFVPVAAIPKRVVKAFLAAEDKNFFSHPGLDPTSILRAVVVNIRNLGSDRRLVGASTITQQVAKNFLLGNEVSYDRKIKEAILALRIERALSKARILELYLNEIYLGFGSYGVAAAALNYFNKPLDALNVAEAAFLAALPKAPNNYHPIRHPRAAKGRRDWVIGRMLADGLISPAQARFAKYTPLIMRSRDETEFVTAEFFAEEVRRALIDRFGESALYGGGLSVRTTLDPRLQSVADRVLRAGLIAYDRRHGWRGPVARIVLGAGWQARLAALSKPAGLGSWRLGVVLRITPALVEIGFADATRGHIPFAEMVWARPGRDGQRTGPAPRRPGDVLALGDVVAVEPVAGAGYAPRAFALRQAPEIDGALVALDPHTGRVLAMSGGYSFARSQFNRSTQALRQPGSAFKPFVYLAALDAGFTPSTLILDAPFVIDQGPGLGKWKPANYGKKFYGPSTMRLGLEKSRNLMTVRLAQTLGIERVVDYAKRFGIVDDMPNVLSMALGAGETTLLRLTAAYGMLVNGGKEIRPTLIDRIQDRHGRTVMRHDIRPCESCGGWEDGTPPRMPDNRRVVADPRSAYQIVSMLRGVVLRGTGRRVRAVAKPVAGKTGTTNDSFDTWFVGFTPDLVVGVFAGFDQPRSLGRGETGSSVAAPIFRDFMIAALADQPAIPFRIPPGIRLVRVDAATGIVARARSRNAILEAFKPGSEPAARGRVLKGFAMPARATPTSGTGGLY